jgi:hypothetical protein
MTPINFKAILYLGIILICTALFGMIYGHEYSVSQNFFIIGTILIGIAYAKGARFDIEINTWRMNKNIQILNDLLLGKKKKNNTIKLFQEEYWQTSIQNHCPDIRETWEARYCHYGGRRGYCIFEQCPRRVKYEMFT